MKAATWATEDLTTEIARSFWPRMASTMATTCSTALPARATITSPAKAWEMCSCEYRRLERVDEPVGGEGAGGARAHEQDERDQHGAQAAQARAPARSRLRLRSRPGVPGRRRLSGLRALPGGREQVLAQPDGVDDEQDARPRRSRWCGRGGWPRPPRSVIETEQHDDEGGHQQQRGGVVGQSRTEAHPPIGRLERARHQHQAEQEQGVGEDRAQDRRLGDHLVTGLQGRR